MRKIGLVALLLAACARDPGRVIVAIAADGTVRVEGKVVTLDELGALLAARRDAVPREDHPYGGTASALRVVLDIEDDVPWSHVVFVMDIVVEQRLVRFIFPGEHSVTLPKNSPFPLSEPDHWALLVRVLILEDGRYVIDERTTDDIREIGAWVEAAPKAFVDARVGRIRAQARAPWRRMRPVLDLFRDLGVTWIDFYGKPLPSAEDRRLSSLPPPQSESRPRAWPGLVRVPYWPEFRYYTDDDDVPQPRADLRAMLGEHCLTLGRAAFDSDDALGNAASAHAEEMRRLGYFGHFSPTPANRSPSDRLARFGWPEERRHAELLAKAETAEAAFKAILAKPENAAILADPAFKYAGVAQCGDCWVVLLGA